MLKVSVAGNPVEDTDWHEMASRDVDEKLYELNSRLEERGFRTRFRIVTDEFGWDIVVDDGSRPELIETVEDAEEIVQQLCDHWHGEREYAET